MHMLMFIAAMAAVSPPPPTVNAKTGGGTMIPVDGRTEIETIVHDYILAHPEIIPQAMAVLQEKQTVAVLTENRAAMETPYAGAWEGAADGDVILVEFFDYSCGYCRASLPDLTRLVAEDKKLKIVYREMPILSENSNSAAKMSLLAAERGQYMAFHKALYAAGDVTRETILAAASKLGVSRAEAESALVTDRYDGEIAGNIRLAQRLRATGTPTFVVGNQILNGAAGYEMLKEAIVRARR